MRDDQRQRRALNRPGARPDFAMRWMAAHRLLIGAIGLAAGLDFAANWLAAHWLVTIGPFLIPGGTFLFALGFTTYDYIRRQHGFRPTLCAIVLGFAASMLYAAAFGGGVGRIAVAGLIALACSSTCDLLLQTATLRWPIWRYVTASNGVSLLIDTVVFTEVAFAALPPSVRLHILAGQYAAKLAMTVVSVPLVYLARSAAGGGPAAAVAW